METKIQELQREVLQKQKVLKKAEQKNRLEILKLQEEELMMELEVFTCNHRMFRTALKLR
jgi:hypothetical protein